MGVIAKDTVGCPDCRVAMSLARIIPALGTLPELKTFVCDRCDVAVTFEPAEDGQALAPVLAAHLR
jgi:hypothetical protein